jgi:Tfp pilus assembly protein FimV
MNTEIVLIIGVILVIGFVLLTRRAGSNRSNGGPVDPIAEAEVFIAYGRKKQALEILENALRENPQRDDIALKLSELKKKM